MTHASLVSCVSAGVCGRQPRPEKLEGHRHLPAGDRGGVLAHHHVGGRPHTRCVRLSSVLVLGGLEVELPVFSFCPPSAEQPSSGRSRLTVADLYKPEFSVHDPEAKWISSEYGEGRETT